jgi:hypothetical protein
MGEGLKQIEPQWLDHIFPGSWIGANFDVWIGAEEDNRAWEYLLRARQTYEQRSGAVSEQRRSLAYEELLIAEGSDWCWWYGPEHSSGYRPEFDQLYRDHLANVYRALGCEPPEELSRPILRVAVTDQHVPPTGPIRPRIDGEVGSYFEWLGAGVYRVDARSGAMHGKRYLIRELHYGSDGQNLYLRVDFEAHQAEGLSGLEARLGIQAGADAALASSVVARFQEGQVTPVQLQFARSRPGESWAWELAFQKILEARLSLAALGVRAGQSLRLQISLWREGLPVDAIPQQGWIEISTAEPTEWPL